jgi:hypothetical protein
MDTSSRVGTRRTSIRAETSMETACCTGPMPSRWPASWAVGSVTDLEVLQKSASAIRTTPGPSFPLLVNSVDLSVDVRAPSRLDARVATVRARILPCRQPRPAACSSASWWEPTAWTCSPCRTRSRRYRGPGRGARTAAGSGGPATDLPTPHATGRRATPSIRADCVARYRGDGASSVWGFGQSLQFTATVTGVSPGDGELDGHRGIDHQRRALHRGLKPAGRSPSPPRA